MAVGLAVLLAGLGVAVVLRGPLFGALIGMAVSVIPALIAEWIARRAERAGWSPGWAARLPAHVRRPPANARRWAAVLGIACLWASVVFLLLRPPGGAALVERHLGLTRAEIANVRSWADLWGIDPVYAVRFEVNEATLRAAVPDLAEETAVRVVPDLADEADTAGSDVADEVGGVAADVPEAAGNTVAPNVAEDAKDAAARSSPFWTTWEGRRSWWTPGRLIGPLEWSSNRWEEPRLLLRYDRASRTAYLLIVYH